MKKIFTLLSVAAFSVAFAQVQQINNVETMTTEIGTSTQSNLLADEVTYSQISSDEPSASISVLSCSSLTAPVQLSRGYDMQADYGINSPFTVTKINIAGRPSAGATVEGFIYNYNGAEFSDMLLLSDAEELTSAYGSLSFSADDSVEWHDLEFFDPVEIPAGQKFLASIVAIISGADNSWANSYIPWLNVDGATETRPSWFGGNYGTCGIDPDGNFVNPLTEGFPDNGVYLSKITGTAGDMGIVQLGGKELAVYPNPATTELNIQLEGSKIAKVEVADVTGRVIPVRVAADGKVNISNLSQGVYFLRAQDDKGVTRIQKFIKK